ncbi:MAG: 3-deoxy-manno-octulosonate cytidylyltransferase [Thermoflavifilum sp.]|nr:3-deoxy-manno-octulosonate cytidylyltransferase [Thermoflavifilum sp.]
MQIIAIIPARYASTRLPGKPLIDIAGKSMIRRVYERVASSPDIASVWVATDDKRIYDHVQLWGGRVLMTSTTHQSGTERCAEALDQLPNTPDIVLNVQGDEPFLQITHLKEVLSCFEDPEVMIASLMKRIESVEELHSAHLPKVIVDAENNAIYFSRQPIPYVRDVEPGAWLQHQAFYKHIGLYAFRAHVLKELVQLAPVAIEQAERLEQLRWLFYGYRIRMAETHIEQFSIDTPEDLARCLQIIQELEQNNPNTSHTPSRNHHSR